jgi:hypothetical protein
LTESPVSDPVEKRGLLAELAALAPHLAAADVSSPREAEASLARRVPPDSPRAGRIEALARAGVRDGWLLTRAAGPRVRFGRLAKDLGGFSVDAVLMEGPAAGHTHVSGEINLGFRWSGDPRFDGRPTGWVVFPPGSHHVPTVTGGEMLLLYFVPGGQVKWDPPAKGS